MKFWLYGSNVLECDCQLKVFADVGRPSRSSSVLVSCQVYMQKKKTLHIKALKRSVKVLSSGFLFCLFPSVFLRPPAGAFGHLHGRPDRDVSCWDLRHQTRDQVRALLHCLLPGVRLQEMVSLSRDLTHHIFHFCSRNLSYCFNLLVAVKC